MQSFKVLLTKNINFLLKQRTHFPLMKLIKPPPATLFQYPQYNFATKSQLRGSAKDFKQMEEEAKSLFRAGIVASFDSKFQTAQELFYSSLDMLLAAFGEEHRYIPQLYNYLGKNYADQWNYQKALEYYEKALSLCEEHHNDFIESKIKIHINLAAALENLSRFNEAEEAYNRALELIGEDPNAEYGTSLMLIFNNLGCMFLRKGEYVLALNYFNKVLADLEQLKDEDRPFRAKVFSNMGQLYREQGRINEAYSFFQEALREIVNEGDRPELATCYNNMGMISAAQKNYDEALKYYRKARDVEERIYGEDHASIGITMNNIALVHMEMGDYDRALDEFHRIEKILGKHMDANDPAFGHLFHNTAMAYAENGGIEKALVVYDRAYKNLVRNYGENHNHVAELYMNIGKAYRMKGDDKTGIEKMRRGLEIRETVLGKDDVAVADDCIKLGAAFFHVNQANEALKHYRRAELIWYKHMGHKHPGLIPLFKAIVRVYDRLRDYNGAYDYAKKVESFTKQELYEDETR